MGIKKQWTGKEKLAIVLQGLKGECSVSELCNAHGITQGMYCNAPRLSREALRRSGQKMKES